MLKVDTLKSQLQDALSIIIPSAIKQCMLDSFPLKSEIGEETAQRFAELFDDMVSENLAELFANAIDAYIKNACIYGTVITVGNQVTQTAQINSSGTPMTNGAVPNTLGIK